MTPLRSLWQILLTSFLYILGPYALRLLILLTSTILRDLARMAGLPDPPCLDLDALHNQIIHFMTHAVVVLTYIASKFTFLLGMYHELLRAVRRTWRRRC